MKDFQNILAVMQHNTEAPRLLNKLHRAYQPMINYKMVYLILLLALHE